MKILLISPKMKNPNGGIAVWTGYYEKACPRFGADCDIVNTEKKSGKQGFFKERQRAIGILRSVKNYCKNNEYDLAHLNSNIGVFGVIRDYFVAKRIAKKKIPVVVHFHCDVPFWVTNFVVKHYLKKLLKISSEVLVLCESSKKFLKQTFGVESIKVPNFIDENVVFLDKVINDELKNIVFVGRVSLDKGAKELYELAKRFPSMQFNFIGEPEEVVLEWHKPNNCCFLGRKTHDEVIRILDESDLFLFPTHTEGFSMALAESMARGLPCVTTDVGANLDMIENEGGVVVEKGDVDAMEEGIKELLSPEKRQKASKWCVDKVTNNYTAEKVMKLLFEQYKSLL